MHQKYVNAHIFNTEKRMFFLGSLSVCDGKITENGTAPDETIDLDGAYLLPGLIDVHTHGRAGIDIMEADAESLSALSLAYAKTGVTTVFPTVMTAPLDRIFAAIGHIKSAKQTATFAGIHVEGPYISRHRAGCHELTAIRMPKQDEIFALADAILPLRPHFTVAPEEDTDGVIVALLSRYGDQGATAAIGHTDADFATAMKAVKGGMCAFTHTFNAMTPMLHRAAGAVGAALYSDACAEFICDGIHVAPEVIAVSYAAKKDQGDKFVLITDSIPQAGLSNGEYTMNGIPFALENGKAARKDDTIVGSALDMMQAVKNLSKFANIPFEEALICATKAPAEMVGIYGSCGSLDIGKRADLLVCDEKMHIKTVICGGKTV